MIDLDIIRAGVNFVRRLGSVNLTEVEDAKVVPVVRGDVRLKEVRVCAVSSERLKKHRCTNTREDSINQTKTAETTPKRPVFLHL